MSAPSTQAAPEPTENIVNTAASRRRELLLDIFAMNSFSWIIAIPIELILAGMSWQEHLKVRLLAVVFNTLIARPFGLYRNWIASRFGGHGR